MGGGSLGEGRGEKCGDLGRGIGKGEKWGRSRCKGGDGVSVL